MVNIVFLDDEIFASYAEEDRAEVYDTWRSDLEDNLEDDFELFLYNSADNALEKIKELGNNTIVILDMKMPEMDGPTFLKMIREEEFTIPVIAYSADKVAKNEIEELLNNSAYSKEKILEYLKEKDYFIKEEMKEDLLKNDIFTYVQKAQSDLSNLVEAINKAIEKFKDNIPLELGEALSEYLDRNPKLKDTMISVKENGEEKEVPFSEIQEQMNKGTTFGKDYQKAIYKMAFEDFKKKRKVIE